MIEEKQLIEVLKRQKHVLTFEDSNPIDEGFNYGIDKAIQLVSVQPKVGEWIPCSERLPEEYDSFFVNFKGTEYWRESMYEKNSNPVLATIEYKNGRRKVCLMRTIDGEWDTVGLALKNGKVLAWQSFPEPFCE